MLLLAFVFLDRRETASEKSDEFGRRAIATMLWGPAADKRACYPYAEVEGPVRSSETLNRRNSSPS